MLHLLAVVCMEIASFEMSVKCLNKKLQVLSSFITSHTPTNSSERETDCEQLFMKVTLL